MEATSGFFQKCQQYLNFRGSNSNGGGKISQNYQVGSEDSDIEDNEQYDEDSNNDQSLSSRFTPFQRSYQKVSTEDKTTKYGKIVFLLYTELTYNLKDNSTYLYILTSFISVIYFRKHLEVINNGCTFATLVKFLLGPFV